MPTNPTTWTEINKAHVLAFSKNYTHAVQQKKPRTIPFANTVTQEGQYKFYNRLGKINEDTEIIEHTRNADTVYSEIPHFRRRMGLRTWNFATLMDPDDSDEILADPNNGYIETIRYAFARHVDKTFFATLFADVATGEDGTSTEVYNSATDKPCDIAVGTGADAALTLTKLRNALMGYYENDYFPDEQGGLNALIKPKHLSQLIQQEKAINGDYVNELLAIQEGKIEKLFGISLKLHNRLQTTSNISDIPILGQDSVLYAANKNFMIKVDTLPTKTQSRQIFAQMKYGFMRFDTARLGRIKVDDTAVPSAT